MPELTDDQLDGLFRKSAEEFDLPYDPTAWQNLRSRLDTDGRTASGLWRLRNRLLRWGLPLLLLLLTGGSWYAYQNGTAAHRQALSVSTGRTTEKATTGNSRPRVQSEKPEVAQTGTPGRDRPAAPVSAEAPPVNGVTALPQKPAVQTDEPVETSVNLVKIPAGATATPAVDAPTKAARATRRPRLNPAVPELAGLASRRRRRTSDAETALFPRRRTTPLVAGRSVRRFSDNARTVRTEVRRVTLQKRAAGATVANRLMRPIDQLDTTESNSQFVFQSLTELAIRSGRWSDRPAAISRTVEPPNAPELPAPVPSEPRRQTALSIRLLVAPDLSAIGLRNFQRPGTNVGALLEYRFAPRWSVQAGVLQSVKVYKASTTDYELPGYTARWPVLPESVNGRCNMLDIPINLRYDVALRPGLAGTVRSRWFVSGGLTTYIMRQEDYTYTYADPTDPRIQPRMREWHGQTGRYDFSQLNLSVGYERALSRRLSGQVEPFLKAPLKGVGYYKINLLSTGAFLSLRYRLY